MPVVEPEILIEGDHDIDASAATAKLVLNACFQALRKEGAHLPGLLLKPQMIIPGSDCPGPKPNSRAIAEYTMKVMRRSVNGASTSSACQDSFSIWPDASHQQRGWPHSERHPHLKG